MFYPIYRHLTSLSGPILKAMTHKRIGQGKEDAKRYGERFGIASQKRPDGKLMWIHGASVGESLSVLPLLNTLQSRLPGWRFLVTTGTMTSATLMAQRLPQSAIHQFMPWDNPFWVKRFFNHWQPDAAIWLESELWPNILHEFEQRHIPAGLLNARMRPKTFLRWKKAPSLAGKMLGSFQFILVGARDYIPYFKELGGSGVRYIGSLKFGAKALPVDAEKLSALQRVIGSRPCFGFMQTHATEETLGAEIFKELKKTQPDLLLILAPRNPSRGPEIKTELQAKEYQVALRSANEFISSQTEIYIADTIGEMGLWYSLCPIAVMGGSFIMHGGQNPIEGAHFGTAILYGPHMYNFPELCTVLEENKAAQMVPTREALLPALQGLYKHADRLADMRAAALALAEQNHTVIDAFADEVITHLVGKE